VFVQGMRMMALVGFIMISAAGFASVMTHTGDITHLVNGVVHIIGDNHALAAFLMLFIGLFVTIGIGSSFSSVPVPGSEAVYNDLQQRFAVKAKKTETK
jgi:predicted histidine transporter YuiF (NhaC family)